MLQLSVATPPSPTPHVYPGLRSFQFRSSNVPSPASRYAEAIELCPDKGSLPALHSNRSLALGKAGRWGEALAEAEAAAAAVPAWHKAQWRRASALLALKRVPEAVLALREAWCLASSSSSGEADGGAAAAAADATECSTRLWAAVQKLTREELARGLLAVLAQMQASVAACVAHTCLLPVPCHWVEIRGRVPAASMTVGRGAKEALSSLRASRRGPRTGA